MPEQSLRRQIVSHAKALNVLGLSQGTSGNLSARSGKNLLITPSGVPYAALKPDSVARMPLDGAGSWSGPLEPSSEWRFHLDILRARPEVGAVVHAHSPYATVLSILRRPIRAVHYMIAAFGGPEITCTDYAPFGTQELSDLVVAGLGQRHGVLLGNHGMIATGSDLQQAMWRAVELETLARQSYLATLAGDPVLLPDAEIALCIERFKSYGPQRKLDNGSPAGGEIPKGIKSSAKPRKKTGQK